MTIVVPVTAHFRRVIRKHCCPIRNIILRKIHQHLERSCSGVDPSIPNPITWVLDHLNCSNLSNGKSALTRLSSFYSYRQRHCRYQLSVLELLPISTSDNLFLRINFLNLGIKDDIFLGRRLPSSLQIVPVPPSAGKRKTAFGPQLLTSAFALMFRSTSPLFMVATLSPTQFAANS